MELLKNYEKALQAIYDHVDFEEDWVVFPIDDCTDYYWSVDDDNVYYAESKEEYEDQEGNYYVDEIYKNRFYKKWVYEGEHLTMIMCDPRVDGMKCFKIFDNSKKQHDEV